jgi:hypothetical protein
MTTVRTSGLPVTLLCLCFGLAQPGIAQSAPDVTMARPKAGPVQIMKTPEIRAGMKGTAWTVFHGTEPDPIPVEILGLWKNAWGPRQDVILAKLGGKAAQTNVAGGMSGSPVYIDGKLAGAVALRISVFSPDAICGITPIEEMLEINEIDAARPADAKTPLVAQAPAGLSVPASLLDGGARLIPIETPLAFAGFRQSTLDAFQPFFEQMGVRAVLGGAAGAVSGSRPGPGWQTALQPGDAIAGMLVDGDMSVTGLGTVTYNDGRRVLGFGHSFFNLGPVSMPMSKGEVLMVLSSQFQPNKFANATEIVGALRQDRHSGIMGVLGATADTIPVSLEVDTQNGRKNFHFDVFTHPRWTPFLMMMTAYNTLQGLNSASADEATYSLEGTVEMDRAPALHAANRVASGEGPMPAPMALAVWWGDRFNRLFQNPEEAPQVKKVDLRLRMIPFRQTAVIEGAWLEDSEVEAGGELAGKIVLRPWRGERTLKDFQMKVPAGLARGDYRLLVSDGDTLNRGQMIASMTNRHLSLNETVSLMNQEHDNNRVYVSLVDAAPTLYSGDQVLADVPPSVMNALQAGRALRPVTAVPETARIAASLPVEWIVDGSATVRFKVK